MNLRLVALTLVAGLVAVPAASGAPAADDASPRPCTGDPALVAACGCPQGFWGVTVHALGSEQAFVCFF